MHRTHSPTAPRQWATLSQLRERYPLLQSFHPRTIKRREDAGRFPRRSYFSPVSPIWPIDECDRWAADPVNYTCESSSNEVAILEDRQ